VRRFRGVGYETIRPLSWRRLTHLVAGTGATAITVVAPPIVKPLRSDYGRIGRTAIEAYNAIRGLPLGELLLRPVAPLFHVSARKPLDTVRDVRRAHPEPTQ
jgi:hypothetical protein